MKDIESIVIQAGFKKTIPARVKHRVRYESGAAFIDISSNGHDGFNVFEGSVTYYCFSEPNVYRSHISD